MPPRMAQGDAHFSIVYDGEAVAEGAMPVAEHVVGPRAVGKRILIAHRVRVRDLPTLVGELTVDKDARESLVRTHRH